MANLRLNTAHFSGALIGAAITLAGSTALAQQGAAFNTGGTRALSRGGAVAARAEDPMVLLYNPAGLADIQGKQIIFSLDMPFRSACVQPYGYYGWGIYEPGVSEFGDTGVVTRDASGNPTPGQYATRPLDEVCDSGRSAPFPEPAFAIRLNDKFGLGFGFVGPSLLGEQQWGGADGTIARDGTGLPTPTRYQLVRQAVTFGLNPTAGIGYRVLRELRVGATFQWIALGAETSIVQAQDAGTSPHNDMLVTVRTQDYFIPSLTFSIHTTPIEELDMVLSFLWRDSLDGSGEAIFETNPYTHGLNVGGIPFKNAPIALDRVHQPLPWALTLGTRYADRIEPRNRGASKPGDPPSDPLATELWDVELDLSLLLNARASEASVSISDTCDTTRPVTAFVTARAFVAARPSSFVGDGEPASRFFGRPSGGSRRRHIESPMEEPDRDSARWQLQRDSLEARHQCRHLLREPRDKSRLRDRRQSRVSAGWYRARRGRAVR